jgi:hypothetical protein
MCRSRAGCCGKGICETGRFGAPSAILQALSSVAEAAVATGMSFVPELALGRRRHAGACASCLLFMDPGWGFGKMLEVVCATWLTTRCCSCHCSQCMLWSWGRTAWHAMQKEFTGT